MIVRVAFLSLNPSKKNSLLEESGSGKEKRERKEMYIFLRTLVPTDKF